MSRHTINRLAKVFALDKSEEEMVELILMNKNIDDLIEVIRGCDIPCLILGAVKKLHELSRASVVFSSQQKKQLLMNVLNSGTSVEETFNSLCEIIIDGVVVIPEEPQEQRSDKICKICFHNTIDVVFLPCGHILSCETCAYREGRCPLRCEDDMSTFTKIYFS